MPANSMAISLILIAIWMLANAGNYMGFYGDFFFNIVGLIPISFKVFMVPIFIAMMIKKTELGIFKRFISPGFSVLAALFLIYVIVYVQQMGVIVFAIIFIVLTAIGLVFEKSKS